MKILILTAFHGRPYISQLYWYGIERLRKSFDIEVCAVVSDNENKMLAKLNDCEYIVETENNPHGRKMNTAMAEIVNKDFDYLMQLGSDNLISNKGMNANLDYMGKGFNFFGHTNLIMVDSVSKECKLKKYGNVFGAGRCISKKILLKSLPLWADERERGMDVNSEKSIEERAGFMPLPIGDMEVIDVKSDENIWKYGQLEGTKYRLDDITGKISNKEYKYLISI